MKLSSFISLALLSLINVVVLSAQAQYDTASDSDPAALKLLETISTSFLGADAHAIEFTLDIELPGSGMETQQGQLIQQGDKFVLDLGAQKIISDSETVWLYLKDLNEVQINDADFDDADELLTGDFSSPSDIFNLYKSTDYVFAIANHTTEAGSAITQIEGKPLAPDTEYSKMRLTVIDKGAQVKRLKIFAKNGGRFTLNIKEHNSNYIVPAGAFGFDASQYEGVHVEDLRF